MAEANLRWAYLGKAKLSGCNLIYANLSEAHLGKANLSGGTPFEAKLIKAYLIEANLSGALFQEADLSGANLRGANLSGAWFQPKPGSLPAVTGLLYLRGLDSLKFAERASYGLMELREIFKKAGMQDEERQLTYALNHTRRVNSWQEIKRRAKKATLEEEVTWLTMEIARLENRFQQVMFEWTCDYGMTPSRPFLIMFLGLFAFTFPYLIALRSRDPETGIWGILPPDRVLDRKMEGRPIKLTFRLPSPPFPEKKGYRFRGRLWRGWRGLRLAFYFSILSAFNIGWRELNVGTWITRIQKREYNLRGTGWVRMLSGIQALLSVYMLALWALTYFGRPFE